MTSEQGTSSNADIRYHSHFGVYALIFDDTGEKILVIKKVRGGYTGRYDLPGGAMEPHELLEETLFREVNEETGCHITAHKQLGAFSTMFTYTYTDGKPLTLRHLAAIYTATITGTPMETPDGQDSGGCVWIHRNDLTADNCVPLIFEALKAYDATA